jgi:pimeloyl-ACP methyl ester carboxylesterase
MLANEKLFPNLQTIVLAGHSAGGQLVQRYAVAGKAPETLPSRLHVRFVIANPSSYAYFSPERPVLDPSAREFAFALPIKTCGGDYDHWKYGLLEAPPYLASVDPEHIEQRYIHRDVIYLLGTADTDPNHPELDKSCSGELQGPSRFFRGKAYFRYLQLRHPELTQPNSPQRLFFVPGVAHEAERMLNFACGLAALFGSGACSTQAAIPRP